MPLNPFVVGCWDGVNLWVQWDDGDPASGYQMRIRFRRRGVVPDASGSWEAWRRTGGLTPIRRAWMVVGTHREGDAVQVQVAPFVAGAKGDSAAWETATEALFDQCTCQFVIRTAARRVHYQPGTKFHAIVDGSGAAFVLNEEVELAAGGEQNVTMTATDPSGYHQLDYPGHFVMRPALGLTIQNLGPTENDLRAGTRDFTQLTRLARKTPVTLTIGETNHFQGAAPARSPQ